MEKYVLIKLFILFVFVYSQNETNACPEGTTAQVRMLKSVKKKMYWQDMWFDEFGGEGNWIFKDAIWLNDPTIGTMSKLRMISPMMGCSYGVELQWFLLLSLESIDACDQLQQNEIAFEDCRSKVRSSIEKGRRVIIKLMRNLQYINHVILNDVNEDTFYQTLFVLEDFYMGRTPEIFSGIIPGGLEFNDLLKIGAESLGNFLELTCEPKYKYFNIEALKNTLVADGFTADGIYLFYVTKLDSYTDFIDDHLTKLGLTPWN